MTSKIKFSGKKVLVLGAGRSGLAAAEVLSGAGAEVMVSEITDNEGSRRAKRRLARLGVRTELGRHDLSRIKKYDYLVVSPGIPPNGEVITAAAAAGVQVISEVEAAFALKRQLLIGVTGTNGKTTTVTLISKILNDAGRPAVAAGNIGYPLSKAVIETPPTAYIVAELSSFQLRFTKYFRPYIAVLLNISPDHFDWHDDFTAYAAAKYKLFARQSAADWAVLNADDPEVRPEKITAAKRYFSRRRPVPGAYCLDDTLRLTGGGLLGGRGRLAAAGEHNLENMLAAAAVTSILKVKPDDIFKSLASFKGIEHRLEFVRRRQGVLFYNDSKATNPAATEKSVLSFSRPVILLAGGSDKGVDFKEMAAAVKDNLRAAFLFGETARRLERELTAGGVESRIVGSLPAAVAAAAALARPGDVVLLAPACASFDMFKNYAERGAVFKEAVNALNSQE